LLDENDPLVLLYAVMVDTEQVTDLLKSCRLRLEGDTESAMIFSGSIGYITKAL
jgi:hypothetical protein